LQQGTATKRVRFAASPSSRSDRDTSSEDELIGSVGTLVRPSQIREEAAAEKEEDTSSIEDELPSKPSTENGGYILSVNFSAKLLLL
jgi:hypothetical protein